MKQLEKKTFVNSKKNSEEKTLQREPSHSTVILQILTSNFQRVQSGHHVMTAFFEASCNALSFLWMHNTVIRGRGTIQDDDTLFSIDDKLKTYRQPQAVLF